MEQEFVKLQITNYQYWNYSLYCKINRESFIKNFAKNGIVYCISFSFAYKELVSGFSFAYELYLILEFMITLPVMIPNMAIPIVKMN